VDAIFGRQRQKVIRRKIEITEAEASIKPGKGSLKVRGILDHSLRDSQGDPVCNHRAVIHQKNIWSQFFISPLYAPLLIQFIQHKEP
jgi:hypothetical protein